MADFINIASAISLANHQWVFTAILLGLAALVGVTYLGRVWVRGRARFERVEKQGSSALLNREMMEAFLLVPAAPR